MRSGGRPGENVFIRPAEPQRQGTFSQLGRISNFRIAFAEFAGHLNDTVKHEEIDASRYV